MCSGREFLIRSLLLFDINQLLSECGCGEPEEAHPDGSNSDSLSFFFLITKEQNGSHLGSYTAMIYICVFIYKYEGFLAKCAARCLKCPKMHILFSEHIY